MNFLSSDKIVFLRLLFFSELGQKIHGFICFIKKMRLILRNYFRPHCYTAVHEEVI
jgi:hypothetical protein